MQSKHQHQHQPATHLAVPSWMLKLTADDNAATDAELELDLDLATLLAGVPDCEQPPAEASQTAMDDDAAAGPRRKLDPLATPWTPPTRARTRTVVLNCGTRTRSRFVQPAPLPERFGQGIGSWRWAFWLTHPGGFVGASTSMESFAAALTNPAMDVTDLPDGRTLFAATHGAVAVAAVGGVGVVVQCEMRVRCDKKARLVWLQILARCACTAPEWALASLRLSVRPSSAFGTPLVYVFNAAANTHPTAHTWLELVLRQAAVDAGLVARRCGPKPVFWAS